jgi:hypothetical protein
MHHCTSVHHARPRFVCHTHQPPETRTCHWGFDSANWAAYIQVAEDYPEEERARLAEELVTVKRRFSHNKVKRKWVSAAAQRCKGGKVSRHQVQPAPGEAGREAS